MKVMKVLVTRKIPKEGISKLEKACEVDVFDSDDPIPDDVLLSRVKDVSGILALLSDNIDKKVIQATTKLKIIANYAVGYNNIDVDEASKRGIYVTNTPDVLTETTADLVLVLILSISRRIVEADAFLRSGSFTGWAPTLLLGDDVYGKTLGILGMGKIGTAVAKRATGFDMKIIYHNRKPNKKSEGITGAEYVTFERLIKESDFLSLNLPFSQESRYIISAKEFDMMNKSSYLINASRGPLVDEKALVKALKSGKIKGAGLDVFENEPKVENELLSMKNVILLPHIGSATENTRSKMAVMAATSITDALTGKTPRNCVNIGEIENGKRR
jgi:glyoxylate reductase